ncbi:MAG: divalent-cation tolerance protein CutA [Candidatus Omnitrophica bacterium]|nr:divalent-cation tolerance protein CutA [Candidatus Omnitrophota bacterium]MDE2010025.1 divalent-cation tolerance protein CutA [Candidatus Omnitrophota bacterium]MDE2215057.1 divalent-cation tolerance protein CutA [Candidatus Omnitrophota bacterium]MDE2231757.1 divalent-cation tolerance protein CutA [Candidatus Omnitrophota bacterium]
MKNFIVVLVTAKDKKEAAKIGRGLLENRLIACANIVEGVQSLFWWEGKIDSSKEALLVLKTKKTLFKKVMAKVKSLHSYKLPEIIALPVIQGNQDYLNWVDSSCV